MRVAYMSMGKRLLLEHGQLNNSYTTEDNSFALAQQQRLPIAPQQGVWPRELILHL